MTIRRLLVSLAFIAWLADSAAQPASDLLQSGIFAQEVEGDIDGAIRIYRQILNSGAAMRLYAAQAQYRLGVCMLRKKDIAGARREFEAVIQNYPDDRELAARARENMPLGEGLLPAPWGNLEVSEYRWTIPDVDDGWSISRIAATGKNLGALRIQMNFYAPQLSSTMVDVDRVTMRPGPAIYRGPSAQNARTARGAGVYRMAAPEGYPSSVWSFGAATGGATPAVYALGELLYLLRRMPLAVGWNSRLLLLSPGAVNFTSLQATVAGIESVSVPAGTFECYKLRLTAGPDARLPAPPFASVSMDWVRPEDGETLWYASGGARPLVKMEFGSARGELTGLRTSEPKGTSSYRDVTVGFSFTVPPGWIYHARNAIRAVANSVDLIDPESQTVVVISGKSKRTASVNIAAELEQGAAAPQYANPQVKTFGTIGSYQALTWIGSRDEHTHRLRYTAWIQSEATRASVSFQADEAELAGILKRLQPILDSFRMP